MATIITTLYDGLRYLLGEYFFVGRKGPILVVGCGHSGTSILRAIIGRNSAIYDVGAETNLFVGVTESRFGIKFIRRRGLKALAEYRSASNRSGALTWVEKTPRHVRETAFIRVVAPTARIVSIVRDGRDVVASLIERGESFEAAIDRWVRDITSAVRSSNQRRGYLIRYEDLVRDSVGTLSPLCCWLGIAYEPSMLEARGDEQVIKRLEIPHHFRRTAQIRSPIFDGSGRWRRDLTDDQLSLDAPMGLRRGGGMCCGA